LGSGWQPGRRTALKPEASRRTTAYVVLENTKIIRVIDGDNVECLAEFEGVPPVTFSLRLIDCWAHERYTKEGKAATAHLRSICLHEVGDAIIPYKVGDGLLQILSFDRVLGLFRLKDGTDLSELQVSAGHATKEKPR